MGRWLVLLLAVSVSVASFGTAVARAPEQGTGLPEGWYARIETSMGTIVIRLLPEQAPQSVAHFAGFASGTVAWPDLVTGELKKGHYYDGIKVHLAEAGQRFEAGDPTGTGRSAPEIYVPREGRRPLNFSRPGRVGMTRERGGKISAVQFFVTATAMPWLNGNHPCFGTVVEGLDVVFNITQVKTYNNGRPIEPVVIESIRIFSSGDPDPIPEAETHVPQLQHLRPAEDLQKKKGS